MAAAVSYSFRVVITVRFKNGLTKDFDYSREGGLERVGPNVQMKIFAAMCAVVGRYFVTEKVKLKDLAKKESLAIRTYTDLPLDQQLKGFPAQMLRLALPDSMKPMVEEGGTLRVVEDVTPVTSTVTRDVTP